MADALSTLFIFFGSVLFVGLKFFLGRALKGWLGMVVSIVLSVVLIAAASFAAGNCQPLATFFLCGILVITGLPGVFIVWLAPLVGPMIPGVGASLVGATLPLLPVTLILLYIAGSEFLVKLFALIGPFIPLPPIPAIAEGLSAAMPIIEFVYGLVSMAVLWTIFSSMAGGIPACFLGSGPSAAIPGTGGIRIGT